MRDAILEILVPLALVAIVAVAFAIPVSIHQGKKQRAMHDAAFKQGREAGALAIDPTLNPHSSWQSGMQRNAWAAGYIEGFEGTACCEETEQWPVLPLVDRH